ncbi:PLC-like phosphodiesterase, TIM beta/alpha-barrel domain-containing protein [Cynara cardunculus var. scolymus]|uniref:PLC-like phosphodiesterase, TIM beta/alpha-barrel domain-containing protein n=1 Tax=Cynara cardunculus var. scolymus TaxID=59895 RepID=A0A118JV43_CYNCS|nr:PLC-like phosphodiesterase, TIM beta/alpha-barrel domain-containing protein [Cynara cardunculus var. scolymus]
MRRFHDHLLVITSILLYLLQSSSSLKIGETCSTANNKCDSGLRCGTCPASGNTRPRCTRIQPFSPTSKVNGLPFNRYTWLTTHNSFAVSGTKSPTGGPVLGPANQEDDITSQLKQPAINVLREIQKFLQANPSEIITIFIEDYVTSPNGLTKVFDASGLSKFMFPASRMPRNGGDWPTITDMVKQNQRLIVFTSKSSKEASEGIAYEWTYVVENQYGNEGKIAGSCPSRSESSPMNTTSRSLVLQNYFSTNPNVTGACIDNSASLISMMNTCQEAAGKLMVEEQLKPSMKQMVNGTCNVPLLSPPPPAQASTGDSAASSTGFSIHKVVRLQSFIGTLLLSTWILLSL